MSQPATGPAPAAYASPEAGEFLAQNLEQLYSQQSETLHVHEQYLSNDAEFSRIFAQLTQAELALLSNPNVNSSQVLPVLEKLEASMMRFHDHQAETLRVHETYLQNQAALAQQLVDLVQAQTGSNTQARLMIARPAQVTAPLPAAPIRVQPVAAPPSIPPVTAAPVTNCAGLVPPGRTA